MYEDACKPPDPSLPVELQDWVREVEEIWRDVELTYGQFALYGICDKGSVYRYIKGDRVPSGPQFLDKLLDILAARGRPVTAARREELARLQLRALQAKHPREYRVRQVSDELKSAVTARLEAERCASALEQQLAERRRQVQELTERLTHEIDEITRQLHRARERAGEAEQHCRQLEDRLDYLGACPVGEDSAGPRLEACEEFTKAQRDMARGTRFGWITNVGPGFQITAPSQFICRLLGLGYEELDGSYLLADPLRGRLQMVSIHGGLA